jgi:hypothetical protein
MGLAVAPGVDERAGGDAGPRDHGQSLYFSSARPVDGVPRDDTDLYVARRVGSGWGPVVHLGPNVNSVRQELYVSVTNDGIEKNDLD